MPFGQVVVGPPGSGKSTYCAALARHLASSGRSVAVVNLDPANDALVYEAALDVSELVGLEAVQEETGLGPNGGLIWAMEYLETNIDWLLDRLRPLTQAGHYIILDCPGQVELFQLHAGFKRILGTLERQLSMRLVAVQLIDAHLCADAGKYMAALLLALSTMLHLELPQVNAFSKYDLLDRHGDLAMSQEFYLEAHGLEHLVESMSVGFPPAFQDLSRGLCEVVEDFGLLSFLPLEVESAESMKRLVAVADKANGYYHIPPNMA
ncbi:hypothetical protein APUTEX25_001816 [Auxenochlorella protothecoides]|uniref:GPN-loop GTPase 2 n=1 Tax=Auxenochlorella protothecoides TaxID=3075 RepID=A0A1D2A8E8_AUXPR|nr:hypothetical protein APUTEX25_001816 [Auxenochlorella protothecoides]|eukprot:RMZ57616.1 hypothetical protein APUTEX25_001816 [Auxenochlorella protothecoides]